MRKGQHMSLESKNKLSKSIKEKYKNGYQNPLLGKRRFDVSEYNKKYKSEQMKGDKNPNKKFEVIQKRLRTINGNTKKIYGRSKEKNNNWKGGISNGEYSFEFNKELKLAVKIRDEYKCKICKKYDNDILQGLVVHHIDYDKKNSCLDNLVLLCTKCHCKTNGNRQKWIEYFSREFKIEKEFINWETLKQDCVLISNFLKNKNISGIVPILRGGAIPAVIISNILSVPMKEIVDNVNDVIIDEIVDFGMTFRRKKKKYPKNLFVTLYLNSKNYKYEDIVPDYYIKKVNKFIVFPWEI